MFHYKVKAHPTMYNGVQYRSRLEARWAAFFDLSGWKHEYEPIDLPGWSPDFRVTFECLLNEHLGIKQYSLFAEVKPFTELKQFHEHASAEYMKPGGGGGLWLGINPEVTAVNIQSGFEWDGFFSLTMLLPPGRSYSMMWKEAGNITQWNKPQPRVPPISTTKEDVKDALRRLYNYRRSQGTK